MMITYIDLDLANRLGWLMAGVRNRFVISAASKRAR